MGTCVLCGNNYDKAFEIIMAGKTYTFDWFECAIQLLTPVCPHCHCKIVGHGVEENGVVYCCAHRAKQSGAKQVKDRA